jgi:hypothetical protein
LIIHNLLNYKLKINFITELAAEKQIPNELLFQYIKNIFILQL